MKRKNIFIPAIAMVAGLFAGASFGKEAPKSPAVQRWNIVAIVPDDHSRRAMGAYGDTQAVTPNFDRLAAQGAKFNNAYAAAPVCSPSRAAFFSGKYPSQVGVHDFLMITPYYAQRGLDTAAALWPQVLKNNGYTTGLIGKWHLGEAERYHPKNRGFDYYVGYEQSATAFDPVLDVNGVEKKVLGHTSNIFAAEAKEFLRRNKDRPFALTITFREPQQSWDQVPAEDHAAVAHIDPKVPTGPGMDTAWLKKETRDNYAAIHALDRAVGQVMDELERLHLADKTIVVYAGDHGFLLGHHGLYGRGAVGVVTGNTVAAEERLPNLFDEAIKIPFLVRWPGVTKPGTVIEAPVSNVDIFRTIMGMLNIPVPANAAPEGRDLTKFLKGLTTDDSEPVFAQYDMENFGIAHLRMVRLGKWKLVKHFSQGALSDWIDELYDVQADPGETQNLISQPEHQAIRRDLEQRLTAWQQKIKDPVLAEKTGN